MYVPAVLLPAQIQAAAEAFLTANPVTEAHEATITNITNPPTPLTYLRTD